MPPFDALYAAWPTWPSKAAMLAVLTTTPRCPSSSGSVAAIASAASASTLNEPIRLISTTVAEQLEVVHALLAEDAGRRADAGAVHDGAQRAGGVVGRLRDGGADLLLGRDVGGDVRDPVDGGARVACVRAGRGRRPGRPGAARAAAVAAPRPEAPPVTMAVVFASCMAVILPPVATSPGVGGGPYRGGHGTAHRCARRPGRPDRGGRRARGARSRQFFLGDPQSYKGPVVRYAGGAAALKADAEAAGVDLYVHAPYPINVATTQQPHPHPRPQAAPAAPDAPRPRSAPRASSCTAATSASDEDADDGLRQLAQVRRRARHAGAAAHREHRGRRQRHGPPARGDRPALGRDRPGRGRRHRRLLPRHLPRARRRQRPRHASSTRCGPSPGASTSCTPTTRRDEFDSGADRHTNFGSGHIDGADARRRRPRGRSARSSCETPGGVEGQTADIAWLRERLAG